MTQAMDLFFDAKNIFSKLGEFSFKEDLIESYENYSMAVLNLLKLSEC